MTAPGGHDRRADVVGRHLVTQAFRQGAHRELGGAIDGGTAEQPVSRDRRDVDDVTRLLGDHVGKGGGDAVEDAL